jgi:protein-tyrosine phosphatase
MRSSSPGVPTRIEGSLGAVIDLHCHILPDLDDGALDLADSVAMARQAEADGVRVVCATPHIRDDHDVRIEQLPERIAELQRELDRHGVRVHIQTGGEVAQPSVERLSDEQLREVSLGGGGWVLLEPAPGAIAGDLVALVQRLQARGVRAIVAHPERHAGSGFEEHLRAVADGGCLLQWTAAFLANPGDADTAVMNLARAGLVHLLASDAHSSHGGRPLRLSDGVARLREACPESWVTWIAGTAPAAILRGEPVRPPWASAP